MVQLAGELRRVVEVVHPRLWMLKSSADFPSTLVLGIPPANRLALHVQPLVRLRACCRRFDQDRWAPPRRRSCPAPAAYSTSTATQKFPVVPRETDERSDPTS